tara:strand:+ start:5187 stop:5690 length:504 start_codon:yes stop_codon:yes gene_type:complete
MTCCSKTHSRLFQVPAGPLEKGRQTGPGSPAGLVLLLVLALLCQGLVPALAPLVSRAAGLPHGLITALSLICGPQGISGGISGGIWEGNSERSVSGDDAPSSPGGQSPCGGCCLFSGPLLPLPAGGVGLFALVGKSQGMSVLGAIRRDSVKYALCGRGPPDRVQREL